LPIETDILLMLGWIDELDSSVEEWQHPDCFQKVNDALAEVIAESFPAQEQQNKRRRTATGKEPAVAKSNYLIPCMEIETHRKRPDHCIVEQKLPDGQLAWYSSHALQADMAICRFNHLQTIYILHLYSGRRRYGDFASQVQWMEQSLGLRCRTATLSVDTAIHPLHGNVKNSNTLSTLKQMIAAKVIRAMLAGPPCETWSRARHNQSFGVEADKGKGKGKGKSKRLPRPLRSRSQPWAVDGLQISELRQVLNGTELLNVTWDLLLDLTANNGCAVIEHPSIPPEEDRASIWRTTIGQLLRHAPCFSYHTVRQRIHGAVSAKPTGFLALRIPNFRKQIYQPHFTAEWQRSNLQQRISVLSGKDEQGRWLTHQAKEYPPSLNRTLAIIICKAINESIFTDANNFIEMSSEQQALIANLDSPFDPYSPEGDIGLDYFRG
jgi:hypothetical protein